MQIEFSGRLAVNSFQMLVELGPKRAFEYSCAFISFALY